MAYYLNEYMNYFADEYVEDSVLIWPHPWPLLLLPWPSGVFFEMQCGGLACYQRHIEGFYLPIFGPYGQAFAQSLEALHPGCNGPSVTSEEAAALDAIFAEFQVPLKVVASRLEHSLEAWVHVEVVEPNEDRLLSNFAGYEGILIWRNCD